MVGTRSTLRSLFVRSLLVVALFAQTAVVFCADMVTVEIETDIGITVFIDGKLIGEVVALSTAEYEVTAGKIHEIWVMGTEAPGVGQKFIVDLSYGDELLEVELGDAVEEWVEDDPEDRVPAPWVSSMVDRLDGTLFDTETNLVWMRRDSGKNLDWVQAGELCQAMPAVDEQAWRLPTMDELEKLVNEDRDDYEAAFLIIQPLSLTGCCAWSNEEYGNISAWYMGFDAGSRGFVIQDYAEGGRALCVRDAGETEEDD